MPRRVLGSLVGAVALAVLAAGCINTGDWSAAPAPVAPVQALGTELADVSCVSQDWCLAVGSMGPYPLAEVWDGSVWSVVTAPSLGGQGSTIGDSVACGSTTSCVAKVVRTATLSPDIWDSAVAWDGTTWHELASGEGPYVDPVPFSCSPDGWCLVFDNSEAETVVWDGDSSTRSSAEPGWDVTAIDCLSADRCVASTSFTTAVWDGVTWSELPGSDTSAIFFDGPDELSCTAVDRCLATGRNASETGPTSATWDGSAWTEVALPAGVSATGTLECIGASECLLPVSGGSPGGMLAWLGGAWHPAPGPPPGAAGLSCLPRWCLAVGAAGSPDAPIAATYTWTDP